MPACGRFSATMRRTPSSIEATAALLSPPRIVSRAFVTMPPASTGSIGAVGSTVSMCAQNRIGVPASPAVAGMRQMTLPASSPGSGGASSCGSSPRSRRYARQRSATARSLPRGARDRRQLEEQAEGAVGLDRRRHAVRSRPACTRCAAPTKSRKSGCGRVGRDLNSGWNCDAQNHGWSGSSITSTRSLAANTPETRSPAASSRGRRWLLTS